MAITVTCAEQNRVDVTQHEFEQMLAVAKSTPGFVKAHVECVLITRPDGARIKITDGTFFGPGVTGAAQAPSKAPQALGVRFEIEG